MPKYPDITVSLIGEDGNAFNILSTVRKELKAHGLSKDEIDSYMEEATSGNYDHLLYTTSEWVNIE